LAKTAKAKAKSENQTILSGDCRQAIHWYTNLLTDEIRAGQNFNRGLFATNFEQDDQLLLDTTLSNLEAKGIKPFNISGSDIYKQADYLWSLALNESKYGQPVFTKLEQEIKELSPQQRLEIRQSKSKPILDEIKKWLDKQHLHALPKSIIAKAVNYSLNNWDALCVYTTDERLNIDNNAAERAIRPVVIGRKNWLFAGSDKGGRMAAILNSVVASCQRHKIDPQAYLTDILPKLSAASHDELLAILPGTWLPNSVN